MTNKEFIEKLKKYPMDSIIMVMGHKDGKCNDWSAGWDDIVEIEYTKKENTLYIEGEVDW